MVTPGIDQENRYAEGCNALRHYSSNVMNVRTVAIVQGFAVAGTAGYLLKQGDLLFSLYVSLFGMLFTALLYSLQRNYWLHFKAFLDYVVSLEVYMSRGGAELAPGPWSVYNEQRKERHRRLWWSISAIHGPSLLLLLALLAIMAYDIIRLAR